MIRLATVDDVLALYRDRGGRSYGEDVTELQHALQAAELARRFGFADAVVAAALLHDVGHLCHDLGEHIATSGVDARHEDLGAEALRPLFAPPVVEAVRLHVAAKRYLCTRTPGYFEGLSSASRQSLALQGGPMHEDECRRFEHTPHAGLAVRVRRCDDGAKVPDLVTPPLESFRPLLLRMQLDPGAEAPAG